MTTTELRSYIDATHRLPPPAERRQIRERAGLSMRQIGDSLGVTGAAVQTWESGKCLPRDHRLVQYVELLAWLRQFQDDAHE